MTEEDIRRIVREELEAWEKRPLKDAPLPEALVKRIREAADTIEGITEARKSIMAKSPVPSVITEGK